MPRPKQLKRELRKLLVERRRIEALKAPCKACGKPLFSPDGQLNFRLIGMSEEPCWVCEERAAEVAPGKPVHVQLPFARADLDPEAEQHAADLAFLHACRYEYSLSDEDIRQRYDGIYEDLDGLLAELDPDGPDEAA